MQAFFEESEKLYTPDSAVGLAAVDGGLFGAVMVAQSKAPTRDAWLAWSWSFRT